MSTPQLQSRPIRHCPHCGTELEARYERLADLYGLVDELYSVMECRSCQLALTSPQPQEHLELLYPSSYLNEEHSAAEPSLLQRAEQWYRNDQSRFDFSLFRHATGLHASELSSYADLGCGTGDRVAYVHRAGCKRVLGVDPFDFFDALEDKKQFFVQSPIENFKPSEKFQLVSLFHVLEHVPDPRLILRHVADHILQRGGYLLIQVPNYGSAEREIFGGRWSALDIPRHFWHFRAEVLQKLLQDIGYSTMLCSESNAALHPVTTASSIHHDMHIQRIWIQSQKKPSVYWTLMKLLWIVFTFLTMPWNWLQNLSGSGSMLTIIARAPIEGCPKKIAEEEERKVAKQKEQQVAPHQEVQA